jgi:ABC-type uncharacterized transport system ATPase subunit
MSLDIPAGQFVTVIGSNGAGNQTHDDGANQTPPRAFAQLIQFVLLAAHC